MLKTIKQALYEASLRLKDCGIDNHNNEATYILSICLGKTKEETFFKSEDCLSQNESELYDNLIEKRCHGTPTAYLRGKQEFFGLDFFVNNHTLIPRPDSEILVETVLNLEIIKKRQELSVLDLGTGSGCILLSILHNVKHARGVGIDQSREALDVARMNAKNLCLNSRALFVHGSWNNVSLGNFDVIISNPPYIKTKEIKSLSKEVQQEPYKALDGGEDGLDCYREILNILPEISHDDTHVAFEIGADQEQDVIKLIRKESFNFIKTFVDYFGHTRVILFKR